ncbi:GNAT family N-acetyltransferase [Prosthecomicrobium hirschii]|uniref:Acetyltransferase n=1 Tax=Prosthecodimorpha hirschii TaxID=665126 RepID=A0A0N8GEW7_9HYPH|nr:GNAT family N-acetyltransferase [Prosthecomicrobium hirschii]KPL52673.1 acetyltransferase [Prosthecomicrobium hirschii]MCW1841557.1 GNAT family N-acetyltransferase [Prosthecomicrobium hirschii]
MTAAAFTIRDADDADMPGIRDIYNDAVANTTAIWNEQQVDTANRIAWAAARRALGYPVLVAECGGTVAGYASFGDFRAFDGYRHTAEHSIYVDGRFRRMGIARALLQALEPRARAAGKHVLIGGIEAGNAASITLHAALGYREVGRLPEVGRKFDRWLDLVFMQKTLD